jgi:hypothetical protein
LSASRGSTSQRALAGIEQRDALDFRVSPHELIVEEAASGCGTVVGHELARRLHSASIAQMTIQTIGGMRR